MKNTFERRIYANAWRSTREILRGLMYEDKPTEVRNDHFAMEFLLTVLLMALMLIFFPTKAHSQDIDMTAISQIESGNDPKAVNDNSGAIGLCQLMPSVLEDFNEHFHKSYIENDLYNGQINLMIADWYINHRIPAMLKHYKIADSVENRLIAYNFGIGNLKKHRELPEETKSYIVKYEDLTSK